jgi:AcrR family transcriptional regulator
VTDRPTSRRERYRAQTRDEAKRIALRQLAESGQEGLSLNAIARELGMTGPALYRYFANRHELLTALIVDAYEDFGAAIAKAVVQSRSRMADDRLRVLAHAVRNWAVSEPHRYLLLFGTPFPGYHAPEAATEAARRSMGPVLQVMIEIRATRPAPARMPPSELDSQLERGPWVPAALRGKVPGWVLADALLSWSRIHGLVSLEVNGQFIPMAFDPALLFDREVSSIIDELRSRDGAITS